MTGFCAKAVLENIVTSANKPNANNFFIAFSLSRDPDFGLLLPRPLACSFIGSTDEVSGLDWWSVRFSVF
jgi:hypothetical protein